MYLKHYTTYTLDCRVGGPPPKRTPTSHCDVRSYFCSCSTICAKKLLLTRKGTTQTDNNVISQFDFMDTYLPQYQMAMEVAGGVMCAYSAENGHPSCANDFLLNKVWPTQDLVLCFRRSYAHLTRRCCVSVGVDRTRW